RNEQVGRYRLTRPDVRRAGAGRTCPGRAPGEHRRSAETAGDVVLGGLLRRRGEHRGGVVHLDELARLAGTLDVEEAGAVRDTGGLLHIVRDDDDRVVVLQLVDEFFDRQRGDGVES